MGDFDRDLIMQALEQMRVLNSELSGLRGEMTEFKNTIKERITVLECSSKNCQLNPSVCATARKLEEHLKHESGKFSKVFTVLSFCVSLVAMGIALIKIY